MRQFIPLITQKKTTSHHHLHPPQHSAQKPQFCARKARKQGFKTAKAHKNPDFVLEMPENGGSRRPKKHKNADFVLGKPENRGPEGQKSTKTHFLCSKSQKMGVPKAKEAQKPRFCAREDRDWHREGRKLVSESITAETFIVNVAFLQITAHASKTQMSHNQTINF